MHRDKHGTQGSIILSSIDQSPMYLQMFFFFRLSVIRMRITLSVMELGRELFHHHHTAVVELFTRISSYGVPTVDHTMRHVHC